jgi:hypothetical protein
MRTSSPSRPSIVFVRCQLTESPLSSGLCFRWASVVLPHKHQVYVHRGDVQSDPFWDSFCIVMAREEASLVNNRQDGSQLTKTSHLIVREERGP